MWALAADTEEEARQHLMTREHWRVGFEKGLRTPLLSPADAALAFTHYAPAERATVEALRAKAIVGSAAQVAARLKDLAAKFALDEIVINTWTHEPCARQHSYALIANAFGISGQSLPR